MLSSSQKFLIGTALLGLFLFGFQAGAWGVLLPDLMAFYRLTPATVGPFFVVNALVYILAVLSSSQLFSRWRVQIVVLFGALLLLLGALILGIKPPLPVAIGAYGLIGLGTGFLDFSFTTMLAQFPRSSTWLNLSQACFGIGGLISPLVTGTLLAIHWGWNSVFFIISGISLAILLLSSFVKHLSMTVPGTTSTDTQAIQRRRGGLWLATLMSPSTWLIGLFITCLAGLQGSLNSWLYSFALNDRHLLPALASTLMSCFWISLLVARLFIHSLAERLHLSRTTLIFYCLAGTTLGLALFWLLPGGIGVAICCIVVGLSEGPLYPTAISLVPQLVAKPIISRSLSLVMAMNIAGFSLLPVGSGNLIQQIGFWTLPLYLFALTAVRFSAWCILLQRGWRVAPAD